MEMMRQEINEADLKGQENGRGSTSEQYQSNDDDTHDDVGDDDAAC